MDAQKPSHNKMDDAPSIAVLPFNNMSGDPEQEYFSDGITEDIITDLSKISGLSVVARAHRLHLQGQSRSRCRKSARNLASATCSRAACARRARAFGSPASSSTARTADTPLGGTLRSRSHRHLRDPGRDHSRDRRAAEGQTAAPGEEVDRSKRRPTMSKLTTIT